MNTLNRFLLVLALGTATTLPAQTDTPSEDKPERPRHTRQHQRFGPAGFAHPVVRAIDTDKDRELSAEELAKAPEALRALDADSDGVVTMREFFPRIAEGLARRMENAPKQTERPSKQPGRFRRGGRPFDPVMAALDANNDRSLSADEIARATASLQALDANKDGKLTRDELLPLPPKKEKQE